MAAFTGRSGSDGHTSRPQPAQLRVCGVWLSWLVAVTVIAHFLPPVQASVAQLLVTSSTRDPRQGLSSTGRLKRGRSGPAQPASPPQPPPAAQASAAPSSYSAFGASSSSCTAKARTRWPKPQATVFAPPLLASSCLRLTAAWLLLVLWHVRVLNWKVGMR